MQQKKPKSRLRILRIIGIVLTISAIYIIWYTTSLDKPRKFWTNLKTLPKINLYRTPGNWINKEGKTVHLDKYKGKISIVSFVYFYCTSFCPRIMVELKSLESQLLKHKDKINFIVFLFDDIRKKPGKLKSFLKRYDIKADNWDVLTTDPKTLIKLARGFKIKYSVIDEKKYQYMHSNLILVIKPDGKVMLADYGLKQGAAEMIKKILSKI